VGLAIDDEAAGSADPFATIMIEGYRYLALLDKLFIEDVEHLEERAVFGDRVDDVRFEAALRGGVVLAPHVQSESHRYL
jgi:hypothetical protein